MQAEKYIVTTGKPAHGGFMIAHPSDGPVIFVRGALPDEKVEITLQEQKRQYWRANVTRVLEAHPQRTPSRCPSAALGAGCCDFAYATPEYARELKSDILRDLLRHMTGYHWKDAIIPLTSSDMHWRLRARLSMDVQGKIGIKAYRSHEIIPVYNCMQYDPRLINDLPEKEIIQSMQHVLSTSASKSSTHPPKTHEFHIHILLDSQNERHIALTSSHQPSQAILVEGNPTALMSQGKQDFTIAITDFWQPHISASAQYCDTILGWIDQYDLATDRVWDLYCGAGVFGSAIKGKNPSAQIVGVDTSPIISRSSTATDDSVQIIQSSVEKLLIPRSQRVDSQLRRLYFLSTDSKNQKLSYPESLSQENLPTLIITDPPRKGLGKALIEKILSLSVPTMILISCDMATFARDLALLCPQMKDHSHVPTTGYHLLDIQVYDAFPGTDHVECMALLTRKIPE